MINKEKLQLLINKYYLAGLNEKVKWVIDNNEITIKFISPNSDLIGIIKGKNFNIKKGEVNIYDTTRFLRLLSVTNKDLFVDLIKEGSIFTKILIQDNQFNLTYHLTSDNVIRKQPVVEEPLYNITINLNNDDILSLIKAKNALLETTKISIKINENIRGDKVVAELIIGDTGNFNDNITYTCQNIKTDIENVNLIYNIKNLKEILNNNKEVKEAKIYISTEGLMKIEFKDDDFESTYFLIQNDE